MAVQVFLIAVRLRLALIAHLDQPIHLPTHMNTQAGKARRRMTTMITTRTHRESQVLIMKETVLAAGEITAVAVAVEVATALEDMRGLDATIAPLVETTDIAALGAPEAHTVAREDVVLGLVEDPLVDPSVDPSTTTASIRLPSQLTSGSALLTSIRPPTKISRRLTTSFRKPTSLTLKVHL